MKKNSFIISSVLGLLLFSAFPSFADAAKVFVDVPTVASVNNTVLVKIMIDTEGKEINAVEGVLTINTPEAVSSINTGGSILHLWPIKPSLEKNTITFTGGTTGAVFGSKLKLFTLALKPTTQKPVSITFGEISTYSNDGKGTKIPTTTSSIEIPVSAQGETNNELDTLISEDKTPPNHFVIDLGRDGSLYDGKYFISFYATDNGSGVDRYEVTEGERPMVRSGSLYVLQNQNFAGTIEVKAIDKAGNVRIEKITLPIQETSWVGALIIILIILAVVVLIYLLKFRKK